MEPSEITATANDTRRFCGHKPLHREMLRYALCCAQMVTVAEARTSSLVDRRVGQPERLAKPVCTPAHNNDADYEPGATGDLRGAG